MQWRLYRFCRGLVRFVVACTMRRRFLATEHRDLPGGQVLAVSHQGHLDPFFAGAFQNRPIVWITRREFYRFAWARFFLRAFNSIRIDRQGIPVSAIRSAIAAAQSGHVVGICPEGGVVHGADACFRGGPIRRGVCTISLRARVPIVPCLILGSARLNRIGPWLPARRGRLWVAYGPPISPPQVKSTRQSRRELAMQLQQAYIRLYDQILQQGGLDPAWVA